MQVVLAFPVILVQFTLGMCVTAWNREKLTKNPYFGGSRSFKVIDAGTPEKLVSSAYNAKQLVCVYLQPISC